MVTMEMTLNLYKYQTVLYKFFYQCTIRAGSSFINPLNLKIKIWGEVDKISSKFILFDHVCNSHDHSVLQSIDITRRNLMLITLRA